MTERELFWHMYGLVMGTDVTYKQVDSDLDEEGDVTIFFSGLKAEEESDDLVLSGYEKGYLTAFYDTTVFQHMCNVCDEDWFSIQIGARMFDLNAWADEETGDFVCVAYECFLNDRGEWSTNTNKQWFLKEGQS